MAQYKISVIVPIYNAMKHLAPAIDSLKKQTLGFESLQVLLVDDHSTDGSYEFIRALEAEVSNITVLRTEKNSGHAGAPRNVALPLACAPYVMFLDIDDVYEPNACELLFDAIQAHEVDCVTGYYRRMNEQGDILEEKTSYCEQTGDRLYRLPQDRDLAVKVAQIFWCKIYRTKIIHDNNLRFFEDCTMEDVLFLEQYLMCSSTLLFIDKLITNYRVRQTSLSNTHTPDYVEDRGRNYALLLKLYEQAGWESCFDVLCYYCLDHYLQMACTMEDANPKQQRAMIEAWAWLAPYTLQQNLFVRDAFEKQLFEQIAAGEYASATALAALYFNWVKLRAKEDAFAALETRAAFLEAENEKREVALCAMRSKLQAVESKLEETEHRIVAKDQALQVALAEKQKAQEEAIAKEAQYIEETARRVEEVARHMEEVAQHIEEVARYNAAELILRGDIEDLKNVLNAIYKSRSYRLGQGITAPVRWIKRQ